MNRPKVHIGRAYGHQGLRTARSLTPNALASGTESALDLPSARDNSLGDPY